jgi:hypothetical protein
MAHSVSFFAASFLLLASIYTLKGDISLSWSGFVLGTAVGLCGLLRWTSGLQAIVPLGIFSVFLVESWKQKDRQRIKAILLQIAVFPGAGILTFSPQMILWYGLHHRLLIYPFVTDGFSFQQSLTNFINLFIHTNRGLLFWSPYMLIGLVGIFWIKETRLKTILAVYVFVFLVLLGTWSNWYGGGGFGPRFFIEALPIAAIGFVSMFQGKMQNRYWAAGLIIFFFLLVLHQTLLLFTVEQAATLAWIPLNDYFLGKPLGIAYQWNGLVSLLKNPSLLLTPRPFVLPDRQTLLVSLFNGALSLRNVFLPLIAILIIPVGVLLSWITIKNRNHTWIKLTAVILLIWMIVWDFILLSVS